MVKIKDVEKNSPAEAVGILPNDALISINKNEINDVLDYRFYLTERSVDLLLSREGEKYSVRIKKGQYEDIGLCFETALMDEKHSCKNGCIFCFIDQNPEGMRESLYFKDDDSRLSFIHGNYITLTNMTDEDVARIVKMRFSPINISVHTTNPELRVKMMKNKRSGEVLKYLDDFKKAGLTMCGQIVLCKGVNDGDELLRTMSDLSGYFPEMSSVAIVPAGLTKYRDKLYPLTDFSPEEAGSVIDMIDAFGEKMLSENGSRMFFAADEFYLKAKRKIPDEKYYEGYSQIENGVGMIRSFTEDFLMAREDISDMRAVLSEHRKISVATSSASYPFIKEMCDTLQGAIDNLSVSVYNIRNDFYGESITVSGLLTGRDICAQLEGEELGEELLIPENALKADEDVFLCGMTLEQMQERLNVRVTPSGDDGYEFVRLVLGAE